MDDNVNEVYVLPMYGEATITQVLVPTSPLSPKMRMDVLMRIRDSRLAEVEQLEIVIADLAQQCGLPVFQKTSEIRREYKRIKHREDK